MKEPEPQSHALEAVLNGVRGISRRGFLALGTLAAVGCATSNQRARKLPDPVWEGVSPKPAVCPPVIPNKRGDMAFVLDRAAWTRGLPDTSDMKPMLPPRYITLHHDGMSPFLAKDQASAAARIEMIRVSHINRREQRFADIGYHFVVDRGGRVWEGRSLKWQGAHVKNHNEHNIGICCLGNFDEQSPSDQQLESAEQLIQCLMQKHDVRVGNVRSHQEWARTACPGASLQREFVRMRRNDLTRLAQVDGGTALA